MLNCDSVSSCLKCLGFTSDRAIIYGGCSWILPLSSCNYSWVRTSAFAIQILQLLSRRVPGDPPPPLRVSFFSSPLWPIEPTLGLWLGRGNPGPRFPRFSAWPPLTNFYPLPSLLWSYRAYFPILNRMVVLFNLEGSRISFALSSCVLKVISNGRPFLVVPPCCCCPSAGSFRPNLLCDNTTLASLPMVRRHSSLICSWSLLAISSFWWHWESVSGRLNTTIFFCLNNLSFTSLLTILITSALASCLGPPSTFACFLFFFILAARARYDYRTISVLATRLWLGRMLVSLSSNFHSASLYR